MENQNLEADFIFSQSLISSKYLLNKTESA